MTSDEQFAACEKTDRAFDVLLGRTLMAATLRLAGIAAVLCAIGMAASQLAA